MISTPEAIAVLESEVSEALERAHTRGAISALKGYASGLRSAADKSPLESVRIVMRMCADSADEIAGRMERGEHVQKAGA